MLKTAAKKFISAFDTENIKLHAMSHIHVTCAIIERDGLVLAAQRSAAMKMPMKWEFPGGKIDPGEDSEACLRRELIEEMNLKVSIKEALPPATHSYPDFTVTLHPFICSIVSGDPQLNEHAAITWLAPEQLRDLDWAEADVPVLAAYLQHIGNSGFCLCGKRL